MLLIVVCMRAKHLRNTWDLKSCCARTLVSMSEPCMHNSNSSAPTPCSEASHLIGCILGMMMVFVSLSACPMRTSSFPKTCCFQPATNTMSSSQHCEWIQRWQTSGRVSLLGWTYNLHAKHKAESKQSPELRSEAPRPTPLPGILSKDPLTLPLCVTRWHAHVLLNQLI
jgi:hypothetical protein